MLTNDIVSFEQLGPIYQVNEYVSSQNNALDKIKVT